jgi:hypothetical protein
MKPELIGLFVIVGGAFLAWLWSAVHFFMVLRHRRDGLSIGDFMVSGFKAFDPNNFKESGQPARRRMVWGMVSFFVFIMAGMALVFFQIQAAP